MASTGWGETGVRIFANQQKLLKKTIGAVHDALQFRCAGNDSILWIEPFTKSIRTPDEIFLWGALGLERLHTRDGLRPEYVGESF